MLDSDDTRAVKTACRRAAREHGVFAQRMLLRAVKDQLETIVAPLRVNSWSLAKVLREAGLRVEAAGGHVHVTIDAAFRRWTGFAYHEPASVKRTPVP